MSDHSALNTLLIQQLSTQLNTRYLELNQVSESSQEARAAVDLDQSRLGRLSRMDALQMQAMEQAAEARRENERIRIKQALQLIEDGDFGWCIRCGDEIALKRLQFDPSLLTCVGCA